MSVIRRILGVIWIVVGVIATMLTCLFAYIYFELSSIEYNANGRYFDASAGVVYHEQSLVVYFLFLVVGIIISCLIWSCTYFFMRNRRRKPKSIGRFE